MIQNLMVSWMMQSQVLRVLSRCLLPAIAAGFVVKGKEGASKVFTHIMVSRYGICMVHRRQTLQTGRSAETEECTLGVSLTAAWQGKRTTEPFWAAALPDLCVEARLSSTALKKEISNV